METIDLVDKFWFPRSVREPGEKIECCCNESESGCGVLDGLVRE